MSALIKLNNKVIGFMGSLHPVHLDRLGLKKDVFLFSVELENLKYKSHSSFKQFSKFPSSSRDLAFILNKSISAHDLETVIKNSAGKYLREIKIFDVYQGKGIDDSKKSLAITISWQSMKQTLLDSDIDNDVEMIVSSVQKELGGELRV